MPSVLQSEMLPRRSIIHGLVNPIAIGNVGIDVIFSAADINDVRVRGRERQRPDRSHRLAVKDGFPCGAAVGRLPHATAIRAKVINGWITRNSRHGIYFTASKRANHPPLHPGIQIGIDLLRRRVRNRVRDEEKKD